MERMNSDQSSGRRSKAQIHELLREFDKSDGLTVTAFCKLHQISKASFYSARSRYRTKDASKQKPAGFIAITQPACKESTGSLFAEVHGIKLYQPVPAEYLKVLVL
jgi:hypothetical protein